MVDAPKVLLLVTGLQGTGKSTAAAKASEVLAAPVLAHDWAMSGLRPYPRLQEALDSMEPHGRGRVGWSILGALGRAQLRHGSSVVLDGIARQPDIELCRQVAADERATLIVVLTECADVDVHRSRIEGRTRDIPNWYELDWDHVQETRQSWTPPPLVDLTLNAELSAETNSEHLARLLESIESEHPAH